MPDMDSYNGLEPGDPSMTKSELTREEDELMFDKEDTESGASEEVLESQPRDQDMAEAPQVNNVISHVDTQESSEDGDVIMTSDEGNLAPAAPQPKSTNSEHEKLEAQVQDTSRQQKSRGGPIVRGLGLSRKRSRSEDSGEFVKPAVRENSFSSETPEEAFAKAHGDPHDTVIPSIETDEAGPDFHQQSNSIRDSEPKSTPKPGPPSKKPIQTAMQSMLGKKKSTQEPSTFQKSIFTSSEKSLKPLKPVSIAKEKTVPKNIGGASNIFHTNHRTAPIRQAPILTGFDCEDPHNSDSMDVDSGNVQNGPATASSPEDEHDWMNIREDEEYEGARELNAEIDALRVKKRNGKINHIEILSLNRLVERRELQERRHGLGRRDLHDDRESLFLPQEGGLDNRNAWSRRTPVGDDEEFEDNDSPAEQALMEKSPAAEAQDEESRRYLAAQEERDRQLASAIMEQQRSAAKKPRRKPAKDAREVRERAAQDKADKEREKARTVSEKKKRGRPAAAGGSKKKVPAAKKPRKSRAKKTKAAPAQPMTNYPGGHDRITMQLLSDLTYNNPIVDRTRQADVGPAPLISANNLKDQWQQLLASVPPDLSLHKLKADKKELRTAAKNFGFRKIKAQDGQWLLKGMNTPLYNHQLLASDWMISRECSTHEPHGGINADAMGLGKTFELLATMIGHPPSDEDLKQKRKSTLIVVPSSVILQWHDEIRSHVDEKVFPRILKYKASQGLEAIQLADNDIVITSYAEVLKSFPCPSAEQAKRLGLRGLQDLLKTQEVGPLHQVEWYRVCLDEAHAIKNHLSKTSIACQGLQGKYRWALTGTPITNRLEELFPYLRFIRAPYSQDFTEFQKHFCDPDADECNSRIVVLLSTILIRRTFRDKLLGRPLIELPNTHPHLKRLTFSNQEQALYRLVERCFRENLNRHLSRGTAARSYGVFFVQLLRLRQLTNHPFLIEQTIKDVFSLGDLRLLERDLKHYSANTVPLYEQIKVWINERTVAGNGGVDVSEKAPFGRSDFGTDFNMQNYLNEVSEEELMQRDLCQICADVPSDPQISDCGHVFCLDCIRNYSHEHLASSTSALECPKCRRLMLGTKPYAGLRVRDDDVSGEGSNSPDTSQARGKGSKAKGKKATTSKAKKQERDIAGSGRDNLGNEPKTKSHWLDISDRKDKDTPLLPSAKTIACKAELLRIFHSNPEDKVLIFTQFRVSARILGRICSQEGWGFVYFTGDMSGPQRYEAVKQFHKDDSIRIMIAGLKCGGVGLNLTVANRVISLDLWWNHSVEQQAFGRVFRIGQKKETHFTRLVVTNSVDQRLMRMQAEKLAAIDRAMQDNGHGPKPLSMSELAGLFGSISTDDQGNIRVEEDYDEEIDARENDERGDNSMDRGDGGFQEGYGDSDGIGAVGMDAFRRGEGSGSAAKMGGGKGKSKSKNTGARAREVITLEGDDDDDDMEVDTADGRQTTTPNNDDQNENDDEHDDEMFFRE